MKTPMLAKRIGVLWLLIVAPVVAAAPMILRSGSEQVSLLELYSSQGCSSCPPAERWVSGLKKDPRLWQQLVPVVFHVDYWNNLGWIDPYSRADYSARQRRYRQLGHINAVYTPGFVLDGKEWRQWFARQPLMLPVPNQTGELSAVLEQGAWQVQFQPAAPGVATTLTLHVALLGFDVVTPVHAGENRGLDFRQDFLVLDYRQFDSADSALPADYAASAKSADAQAINTQPVFWLVPALPTDSIGVRGVALWVTESGQMRPLQAVGGWL